MSGPIVRSGPNPTYSANWDQAFGGKKTVKSAKKAKSSKKAAPKKKKKK